MCWLPIVTSFTEYSLGSGGRSNCVVEEADGSQYL